MNLQQMKQLALAQLATDFDTTPQALTGGKNLFTPKTANAGKRPYKNNNTVLQMLVINGILVCCCTDDALLERLETGLADFDAAWFFSPGALRRLDEILAPFGQQIGDTHLYFLPEGVSESREAACPEDARWQSVWFDQEGLARFASADDDNDEDDDDDDRFDEALGFNPACPDMLAVAAKALPGFEATLPNNLVQENPLPEDRLIGMAGASRDCATMWQIGVNVNQIAAHRGVGQALVTLLTSKLLADGIVPFYGTAFSHLRSLRLAVHTGFVPFWAELDTKSLSAPGKPSPQ